MKLDLDTIEKRATMATGGGINVHRYDDDGGDIRYQVQSAEKPFPVLGYFTSPENRRAKSDAEFFAHARGDVTALVARIRELEARLSQYEGESRDEDFLLLSAKWTRGDLISWWGPNRGGYYTTLPGAGRYSEQEARSLARGIQGAAWPVPLRVALEHARLVVPNGISKFESFNPEPTVTR